jgi:hypothetical protein
MSKARENMEEICPPPKGDGAGAKTTTVDGASRDSYGEQFSSKPKQLKLQRKIDKLRKMLKDSKSLRWLLPLHQIKRLMLHPKKKLRARKEEREIRDLTTLLHSIMITCLPLASSLRYPLVKPPVSMGWTIPNGGAQ